MYPMFYPGMRYISLANFIEICSVVEETISNQHTNIRFRILDYVVLEHT